MKQFSEEFNISLPAGLPPRSLKEIYQLPHKGKGGDEDDESVKKDKKDAPVSVSEIVLCEKQDLDISNLLGVESTKNMSDVMMNMEDEGQNEFMREIGWTDEAETAAEYASQHIMFPFSK